MPLVDVLVPSYNRPAALAVTLAGLAGQTYQGFSLVVSDQSDGPSAYSAKEAAAVIRLLRARGNEVQTLHRLPPRGMAEQRQFLLVNASAPFALFLADDLLLEPYVLGLMLDAIQREGCGFTGCAPISLSYADDHRPQQKAVEFCDGPVHPEVANSP